MPLYINDEIVKEKPKELWKEFKQEFAGHLDGDRIVKPIVIKYVPWIIAPMGGNQELNKGKVAKPASLEIRYVSKTQVGDANVFVRYTATVPTKSGKDGVLTFADISTEVNTQMITSDIDLVFYFWAYSNQNYKNDPDAKLMIENRDQEIKDKATAIKNKALISSRLWNSEDEGGTPFEKLVEFARTRRSIYNLDEILKNENSREDEVRTLISQEFTIGGPAAEVAFLNFTQPDVKGYKEEKAAQDVIGKALEAGVIKQISIQKKFVWSHDNSELWSWVDGKFHKPALQLYEHLEKHDPDTLKKLIELTENPAK